MRHAIRQIETAHAMAKVKGDTSGRLVRANAALERCDDGRSGPPRHVKSGAAVARPARAGGAALRPSDGREPAHAHVVKPRSLLAGSEVDVRLGPLARPVIVRSVETRRVHPVAKRELARIPYAEP